MLTFKRTFIER